MEHPTAHDHGPLRRSSSSRLVAGVCAGIAERFGIDVTLVRIGVTLFAFFGGLGLPLYLAAWLLVPEEGDDTPLAERLLDDVRDLARDDQDPGCPVHGRRDAAA